MKNEIDISPRQIANAIDNLLDERNELQERIDKAIGYIEDTMGYYESLPLLDILGGKE